MTSATVVISDQGARTPCDVASVQMSRQGHCFPLTGGKLSSPFTVEATAVLLDQTNSVPSTHMRCRMTASLRATATLAFLSQTVELGPEPRCCRPCLETNPNNTWSLRSYERGNLPES
jgi:hypothetical protein